MDFSLKKSFKSYGSKRRSSGDHSEGKHEEVPILFEEDQSPLHRHNPHATVASTSSPTTTGSPTYSGEVIVKIDDSDPKSSKASAPSSSSSSSSSSSRQGGETKLRREPSCDFWKEPDMGSSNKSFDFQRPDPKPDDPPSKLIGNFLHRQQLSGDMSLDMDLEMDELQHDPYKTCLPPLDENSALSFSRELKVSFDEPRPNISNEETGDSVRRRYKDTPNIDEFPKPPQPPTAERRNIHPSNGGESEVVRCTSNASFERTLSLQRKSGLLRAKTKSRLIDPPDEPDRRSGRVPKSGPMYKSGQIRSGQISGLQSGNTKRGDEEDDDPFMEEDIPDDFRKTKFSLMVLLEWLSLISIVAALLTTLCTPFLRTKNLWKLKLWKWEMMVLVLICGRLGSDWVIRIAVYFIERNFLLRKRVLYFVYGVKKAVQNCLWLAFVLIAWHSLFDKKVERETKNDFLEYVTKVLICFLVGTVVWLVKTLMVKVLASSFHVSTYFDRIQESLFNQFVIETLSGPPLIEIQRLEEEEEKLAEEVMKLQNAGITIPPDLRASAFSSFKSPKVMTNKSGMLKSPHLKSGKFSRPLTKMQDDGGIPIDYLHRLNPKNVSAWNMKRLMNIVRHGALSTLDEQIQGSAYEDEHTTQIRSENEAKAAAKKIFQNVTRRGYRFIYLEDILRFMREDEAVKTFSLFEGAPDSGKISKSALKNWVVHAFRERRALALTLNDTKTAVNKLHRMLNFLVAIIILIIWLLILEIATSKFLVVVSSQLVLAAFIFGNTCKTIFEAIIFLFVMHPFDVGDRCEIEGIQMVVEEMNILTTVFLRYDNLKVMIPNSVLATKAIYNFYRSPDMGEAAEFLLHIATPPDKITLVLNKIHSYIEHKKEFWYPSPMIVYRDMDQLNAIKIAVWPSHRMNHQDMGERFIRRSHLIEEMIKIFREVDIQFRLLPLDVNVRATPTTSDRIPPSWVTMTNQS